MGDKMALGPFESCLAESERLKVDRVEIEIDSQIRTAWSLNRISRQQTYEVEARLSLEEIKAVCERFRAVGWTKIDYTQSKDSIKFIFTRDSRRS
jgi:hypothetical protein